MTNGNLANDSSSNERWKTKSSKPKQLVKRKRLATLMPTFDSPEVVEAKVESPDGLATDTCSKPRLPVLAPSYNAADPKAAEPSIENEQLPSPEEVIDFQSKSRPSVPKNHSRVKVVAFSCAFAMVLGGFIWVFAYQVPRSKNSHTTQAKIVDSQPAQSTSAITDDLVTVTPKSQPSSAPLVALSLLIEPPIEDLHQEQQVELTQEVGRKQDAEPTEELRQVDEKQFAQEANQEQKVQLKEKLEAQSPDEDAALVARFAKLLGKPAEDANEETEDADEDIPLQSPDEGTAQVARVAKLLGKPNEDAGEDVPLPDAPPAFEQNDRPELKEPIKIAGIQKLSASQLREMLQTQTPTVDLLKNIREFSNAKSYISKKIRELRKQEVKTAPPQKTLQEVVFTFLQKPAANAVQEHEPLEPLVNHLLKREDLQALPLATGDQCRVDLEDTVAIKSVSSTLGGLVSEASSGPLGIVLRNSDNAALRGKMIKAKQDLALNVLQSLVAKSESHPQYLKTTDHILQVQHWQDRLELIETLKGADNRTAANLLAKRAKYDLSSSVRIAATNALAKFPRDQYRDELLAGLKYPWHVVAQHSAEALVRLDDKEAIPELVEMLDLPHPNAPVETDQEDKYFQPTLVAINHMRNCLLCHAPSQSSNDIVTGVVPNWDQPVPPQSYVIDDPDFVSVRADITYLKQDFSVIQPVANHGPWPNSQRFDYVVQQKPLKKSRVNNVKKRIARTKNLNREAIVFALQKLTGQSPKDNSSESWKAILEEQNALLGEAE